MNSFRPIRKGEIGEILQRIYNSEIHFRLGWLWDGGVSFLEGSRSPDPWEGLEHVLMRHTEETEMEDAFDEICEHLVAVYAKSDFAKWFIKEFSV